jgi:cGMP-dependent protein kinase 1
MRQLTVRSDDEVTCLVLGRDTLNRVLGDKVYDVTFKNFIRWAFEKNNVMSKFSREQQDNIIESMKISSFKINELIFRKGVSGFQKLIVVIEGGIKKIKTGTIVAGKCQCYGEEYLTNENRNKIMDDEIVMQTNGVIAEISDASFYEAIGNKSYNEIIKSLEQGKQNKFSQYENMTEKQLEHLDMSDITVSSTLSKGQFGDLYLSKDKKDNEYIAKTMSRHLLH